YDILVSRNVQFEELIFPYPAHNKSNANWEYIVPNTSPIHVSTPIDPVSITAVDESHDVVNQPNTTTSITEPIISARKSSRQKNLPAHLQDYVCNNVTTTTPYPISNYTSHHNLSAKQLKYTLSLLNDSEPTSYSEACQHPQWVKAMDTELQALQHNNTWTIVDLPVGAKAIGRKWVYKIKRKSDGSIERYKARLVAKGYNQVEGIDYFETFSPVAKMTTIRVVLAIASSKNWFIHQLDVDNAFLHGDLCENVYMKIPQ
ncbi:putative retroelement pol polyprotein, partial [Trifolium medium]|nr:putative retroelement pol polyprotein [Trifolium medium]